MRSKQNVAFTHSKLGCLILLASLGLERSLLAEIGTHDLNTNQILI